MEYPVYLQMTETENVVAIQGPNRFWEGQMLGNRVLQHDVVCQTWPERQRVMDMLSPTVRGPRFPRKPSIGFGPQGGAPQLEWKSMWSWRRGPRLDFLEGQVVRRVATLTQLREALAWAKARRGAVGPRRGKQHAVARRRARLGLAGGHPRGGGLAPRATDAVVSAGAGEPWHGFVMQTLDDGWHGLENLSLIPGNVGASPMQNIGAYGVEVKDHFAWLDAVRIEDGALERFDAAKCNLGTGKACSNGRNEASGSLSAWRFTSTERSPPHGVWRHRTRAR